MRKGYSPGDNYSSLKKKLRIRFMKKRQSKIRNNQVSHCALADDKTGHLPCVILYPEHLTSCAGRNEVKLGRKEMAINADDTLVTVSDTESIRQKNETALDESATSDAPNIQILMHDIKQALFQTSIPDHEQHENKVSTIDFVRLPINDIEEETMEEVLIDVINEDDYNSYSRIDTSLFDHDAGDGKTKPAFVAALENLRREGPWIDTPGLVEIEYEEGNSIDEDSENVENPEVTLEKVSESRHTLIAEEVLDSDLRLSMGLACDRKRALILKRRTLARNSRQIHTTVSFIVFSCAVIIMIYGFKSLIERITLNTEQQSPISTPWIEEDLLWD